VSSQYVPGLFPVLGAESGPGMSVFPAFRVMACVPKSMRKRLADSKNIHQRHGT